MSATLEEKRSTVVPFARKGKAASTAVKQASRWETTVNSLWQSGRSEEVYRYLDEITAAAEGARHDGDAKLAARLLTTAARSMHTLGELSTAEGLLRSALHIVDYLGKDTLNNIQRLGVRIALDQGRLDQAVADVAKIDRPIINRSATLITEDVGGRLTTRLDRSEAGDQVREDEGEQSASTALLQAETLLTAGDFEGARRSCDHAQQMLLKVVPEERDPDDVAMLSLLRNLNRLRPDAGDPQTLSDHARMSAEQEPPASAAVIARFHAAAGRLEPTSAINQYERERYQKLGREARAATASQAAEPRREKSEPPPPPATPNDSFAGARGDVTSPDLGPTAVASAPPPDAAPQPPEPLLRPEQELSALLHLTHTATTQPATHDVEESKRLLSSEPVIEEFVDLLDTTLRETRAEAQHTPAAPSDPNVFSRTPIGGQRRAGLYSVLNMAEMHSVTGVVEIRAEAITPLVYVCQGRVAYAVHPAHPDDPGAAFIEIVDMTNAEGFEAEAVVTHLDTIERIDLLHKFSSNTSLMLWTANRGMTPEATEEPEGELDFGENRLPVLHSVPPAEVITAGDALLGADNMADLAARLAEHCTHLGAKDVRVTITVGKETTLASHPPQRDDVKRDLLLEAKSAGSALRLTVEASEPPAEEDKLRAISLLGRSARFQAVSLPAKSREEARTSALRATSSDFIWTSNVMFGITTTIQQLAPADGLKLPLANVLLRGETGTGKEKAAELIHRLSNRHNQPLVRVNMAAISETLAEAELFGHTRGAYTGADRERVGLIESAHGGTLFLDEIGDCPPSVQAKLLRAMSEGEIMKMGESRARKVDVRWILATDQDTSKDSNFRQQLVHRCHAKIDLPPLRSRREDIPLLARHFAQKNKATLTDAAVAYLEKLDYPGNVRDLNNTVQMAALAAAENGGTITPEHAQAGYLSATKTTQDDQAMNSVVFTGLVEDKTVKQQVEEFERMLLQAAVTRYGSARAAVTHTGLSRNTLYRKLSQYGIKADAEGTQEDPSGA